MAFITFCIPPTTAARACYLPPAIAVIACFHVVFSARATIKASNRACSLKATHAKACITFFTPSAPACMAFYLAIFAVIAWVGVGYTLAAFYAFSLFDIAVFIACYHFLQEGYVIFVVIFSLY